MIAITLWQPWASLIAAGVKTVETRSWRPPQKTTGRWVAIHAGKTVRGTGEIVNSLQHPHREDVHVVNDAMVEHFGERWATEIPYGKIVCIARVTRIVKFPNPTVIPDGFGDYGRGRFGWVLDDIHRLEVPPNVVGKRGIWVWDELIDDAQALSFWTAIGGRANSHLCACETDVSPRVRPAHRLYRNMAGEPVQCVVCADCRDLIAACDLHSPVKLEAFRIARDPN